MHIRPATPTDDAALATLFAAYAEEFGYELGDQDLVSEGQAARATYAAGALLVAAEDGGILGCVGYEPWGEGRARMKRMFVPGAHRGKGLGRALAHGIVGKARHDGYKEMVLDTSKPMAAATALYQSMGFEPFEPDYEAPCREVLYLRLAL